MRFFEFLPLKLGGHMAWICRRCCQSWRPCPGRYHLPNRCCWRWLLVLLLCACFILFPASCPQSATSALWNFWATSLITLISNSVRGAKMLSALVHSSRRKFRSQTSDNMDRWKAEVGRVREEKRRRKKIKKEKVSEERRSRCAIK